ncbi:MAG: DUF4242 domain-containing protein [Candidatus Tectomicrobia bacterium]|uniref:DUF4242 domain-containing protein n=1 Tax=Tectimicrobiota bacterium TaxID=2528274 RepID=A0A932I0J1_UNCTE|nr:DUF4242 domain-containing protein [Candidatus Tectomicrobia bacterium]
MPKYVIEREIPGAGGWPAEKMRAVARKSNEIIAGMKGRVQWQHSYVVGDKIYCVYIAESEAAIREHAKQGGFPANRIEEIRTVIDPTTAE